ncbi:conserved hypothetical protein [Beggiatoa sp. PS]|nr:conserved hypothetical protein [Beggiatoa sp. PS]
MLKICGEILGEKSSFTLNLPQLAQLWERGCNIVRQRIQTVRNEMDYLTSLADNLGSLIDQVKKVGELREIVRGMLDKQRLSKISELLTQISDYTKQNSFIEKERLATIIRSIISQHTEEIENSPTKYSLELFHPYLLGLGKTVEKDFKLVQQTAEPEKLAVDNALEFYIPNRESVIGCHLTVSNESGRSPVSAIVISIEESPTGDYIIIDRSISINEALQGGEHATLEMPIKVTNQALTSKVFTLHYSLSYTTRAGKLVDEKNQQLAITIGKETDFQKLDNPYAEWAEAAEVTDVNMFFGREQLIDNLASTINNANTAKSLVIYGQKRTGKSSILHHLEKRLKLPIIPVKFSIGDITTSLSLTTFLYRITQRIETAFEDLADNGYPQVSIKRPALAQLQESPELTFHDYMEGLRKILKQETVYQNAKIILFIDEFTYVYGEFMKERIPDTFMKFWKAILQKGYFGSVIVGQDTMPRFIARFPNEFQVAQAEKVSYLAEEHARQLIEKPIHMPTTNESRYKGSAVDKIMELTACNPFYIQIFCNRLVEYMNEKRLARVTDAHIERVKQLLISGNNSLSEDKFDNLISADEDTTNAVPRQDSFLVLMDIAQGSRMLAYCDSNVIRSNTSVPIDDVLDDLVKREVLDNKGTSFRIKVGLFKEWLLAHK